MRLALPLALICGALIAAPAQAATGTWQRLATGGPSARADAALAAPEPGIAYLHGGQSASGNPLDDLWRLDVKRKRWTRLRPGGPAPAARFGHDMVALDDGRLLLFGGQSGEDFFGDLWIYDPRRETWAAHGATGPAPRYGAGVALDRASDSLFVTHGFTNDGRFDDTWAFAGDAFTDASAPPGARPLERCLVGAAYHRGGLFLFGGQSNPRPFLDDLWRYDSATGAWSELAPRARPSARNSYGSAQLGRRWVIHGGSTRAGFARDVWMLDLARPTSFTRVGTRGRTPGPHANGAMTGLTGSRALVFGGATDDGDVRRDTWLLRVR